jgi:hypothetical protein
MTKRSILIASVLTAIGCSIPNISFAVNYIDAANASTYCKPGFYAGVQGGRTDTFYKPNDVFSIATANNSTSVITGDSSDSNIDSINSQTQLTNQYVDDTGIGGRLYAGYQFTPFFATELGYTQFAKTSFSADATTTWTTPNQDTFAYKSHYDGEITENAVDLVAKATAPIQYGLGLYVKAGAAYITADRSLDVSSVPIPYTAYTKTYQAVRPVAGAGINYTFPNTSFALDLSYMRIFGSGAIRDAQLGSVGIEYKFA